MSGRAPAPGMPLGRPPGLDPALTALLAAHPRETWPVRAQGGLGAMWLARHGLFRDLTGRLDAALAGLGDGAFEPAMFRRPFDRFTAMLLGELETHHNVEDQLYFPAFAAAAPALKRGFDLLDGDHGVLHDAMAELYAARSAVLRELAEGGAALAAERGREALVAFRAVLTPHLDDEEDLVIPLILDRADDPRFG